MPELFFPTNADQARRVVEVADAIQAQFGSDAQMIVRIHTEEAEDGAKPLWEAVLRQLNEQ